MLPLKKKLFLYCFIAYCMLDLLKVNVFILYPEKDIPKEYPRSYIFVVIENTHKLLSV